MRMKTDIIYKNELLNIVNEYNKRYELSRNIPADYFEPGLMENLDQYHGTYDTETNTVIIRFGVKGLRYDNRTHNIETLSVGDNVSIIRENDNSYNTNNFTVKNLSHSSLGNLPKELCNALAPLYDNGNAVIVLSKVSYIEKIRARSRYAVQGVLFLELQIKLFDV